MRGARDPRRDALIGLAPVAGATCPRCGSPTTALANGRGRLDLCDGCGTIEFNTAEGIELFSAKGPSRAPERREWMSGRA